MEGKNAITKFSLICCIIFCIFICASCNGRDGISLQSKPYQLAKEDSIDSEEHGKDILRDIPRFSGMAYVEINHNVPYFTSEEKKCVNAFETYSELDDLGRCGTAYANICKEIMPTAERDSIGNVRPSGWQIIKYDFIDGKYLYNRCHLIGYQLAGENDNEKNLITGTRYLNVSGMLPFENMVSDYVKETNHHVLYRVTPLYKENDLLATGVQMEAYSVEDDGEGVCFNVFIYNSQPGVMIDYATGESTLMETDTSSSNEAGDNVSKEIEQEGEYILNTNTMKFHLPSCSSVDQIKEENRKKVTSRREKIIDEGYLPCQRCKP